MLSVLTLFMQATPFASLVYFLVVILILVVGLYALNILFAHLKLPREIMILIYLILAVHVIIWLWKQFGGFLL